MNRGRIGQGRLGQTIERCLNRRTARLRFYSDTEWCTAYCTNNIGHRLGGLRLPCVFVLGRLTFQRSLLEGPVLWFFNLRVVNVQPFALWVLLGFLDVREGRPGVFRDKVYWWIGFLSIIMAIGR